ncbi:MAG: hypothetical protein QM627_06905 [Luteolibacter sp.]
MSDPQMPNESLWPAERAPVAILMVGSTVTAIASELVADLGGYEEVLTIVRRGASTRLPKFPGGSELVDSMKYLKNFGARPKIEECLEKITEIVDGRPFDCFIHHSTAIFAQVLSSHPLCRKYFYLEEGITAMLGGQFGRPKKRHLKRWLWHLRSRVFFSGRVDKYRPFFDTESPKYGGACALTKPAFKGFPRRIQLPYERMDATVPPPAEIVIFLDSQYIQGACQVGSYLAALTSALAALPGGKTSAAVKFHPAEKDATRRKRIFDAIRSVETIDSLIELPAGFSGERMILDPSVKIVVGTSAAGFYIGERGFPAFTFARRIVELEPSFKKIADGLPPSFLDVCRPA